MHVASFPCPHCAIPLRVRDRGFVGRTISCPECRQPVTIADDGQGLLFGTPASTAGTEVASSQNATGRTFRLSPAMISWGVAGCLVLGLCVFLLWPTQQHPAARVADGRQDGDVPTDPVDHSQPDATDGASKPTTLAERLASLHELIAPASASESAFPVGTQAGDRLPVEQRFSWIAALSAARDPNGPQPRWDRGWSDAANERFVRRQLPQWLNPAVRSVVSKDRYPATHFVGVAGVGPDAAALPVEHPRAGIFGNDRRARAENVGDGLANTMLIAGVEEHLGSWAAGGEATVRGFTAEPYLHGPDGFGTGEEDGMHVLMADGSVRLLSRKIAPTIVRRMASMNDGLPLDLNVPGEPGSQTERSSGAGMTDAAQKVEGAVASADAQPANAVATNVHEDPLIAGATAVIAGLAGPQELPIDVLLAEPEPIYDVEAALAQPIVSFQQKDPVPVRDLLRLIEEMAAVPIRDSELPLEALGALDQPITLTLSEVSVGDILTAVLDQVGLTCEKRPQGIFVVKATPAANRSKGE